jgi:hypothetical protein
MFDPTKSMFTILAAAEAGQPLTATESELRERLSALIGETMSRGWSVQQRGEYQSICKALDKAAAERSR